MNEIQEKQSLLSKLDVLLDMARRNHGGVWVSGKRIRPTMTTPMLLRWEIELLVKVLEKNLMEVPLV